MTPSERDVPATRSPCWPKPIGTIQEILSIEGNKISVIGLDALNGTPILDIKPYESTLTHCGEQEGERQGVYVE